MRLQNATRRTGLSEWTTERAVGNVSEDCVRLQRAIPFVRNSFKPVFLGSFVERDGRTLLEGGFTVFRATRIFMTFWFAFILLWTLLAIIAVLSDAASLRHRPNRLLVPVAGVAFFFGGLLFLVLVDLSA